MRVYIFKVASGDERAIYHFTKTIRTAHFWPTMKRADLQVHCQGEITIKAPFGGSAPCTDFRVESRPQGGFAISCEYPFSVG